MLEVYNTKQFSRQLKKLDGALRDEVIEKVELFADEKNHKLLKVHKLKGSLKNRYSFSIDYKHRIVFKYINKKEAVLLAIGDHSVYEN